MYGEERDCGEGTEVWEVKGKGAEGEEERGRPEGRKMMVEEVQWSRCGGERWRGWAGRERGQKMRRDT